MAGSGSVPWIRAETSSEYEALPYLAHFKNDVRGTHHSISRRWMDSYLNEWVWKWNHREDDRAMFLNLLDNAAGAA